MEVFKRYIILCSHPVLTVSQSDSKPTNKEVDEFMIDSWIDTKTGLQHGVHVSSGIGDEIEIWE